MKTTGMTSLGIPASGASYAFGISDDGLTVVGQGQTGSGPQAYRWTQATGVLWLGDLPGDNFESVAYDASADGSIIVGLSRSYLGQEAFIWDASHGMRNLRDLLIDEYGVDLNGWILQSATSVSADGMSIVGFGINPRGNTEAWLVELTTEPTPQPVTIDIKPGSDPNSVNCNNDKGVISVAILTTDDFDAATVDHSTVTFEWAGETHVDRRSGEPRRHEEASLK
jgi:uncharacterized membrane protein